MVYTSQCLEISSNKMLEMQEISSKSRKVVELLRKFRSKIIDFNPSYNVKRTILL